MERISVARDRLAFALSRVLSPLRKSTLDHTSQVLDTSFSRARSRSISATARAMRTGRSVTETGQKTLDGAAQALMMDLLRAAEKNATKKSATRKTART